MTSKKQVEANRRNSQKSTGPKTPRGKQLSKTNGLKHGLFSKEIIIRTNEGKENWEELSEFLQDLVNTYKPVGLLEEQQIEIIATISWRIKRTIRKERGEIQRQQNETNIDDEINIISRFSYPPITGSVGVRVPPQLFFAFAFCQRPFKLPLVLPGRERGRSASATRLTK